MAIGGQRSARTISVLLSLAPDTGTLGLKPEGLLRLGSSGPAGHHQCGHWREAAAGLRDC